MATGRYYLPEEKIEEVFDVITDLYHSLSKHGFTEKQEPLKGSMILYNMRTNEVIGKRTLNRDKWPEGTDYSSTIEGKMKFASEIGSDSGSGFRNPILFQEGDCEWAGLVVDPGSFLAFGFSGAEELIDELLSTCALLICAVVATVIRNKELETNQLAGKRRPGKIGQPYRV